MSLSRLLILFCLFASPIAQAGCIEDASLYYRVNPDVLKSVAILESRANPNAVRVNTNGTVDRGLYQINSIHLKTLASYGIGESHLHDVCWSSYVAAWLLSLQMTRFGNTWEAVGAYHSPNNPARRREYAERAKAIYEAIRSMRSG
jgi:soluble lytic murein transglycosylase-like protein